MNSHEQKNDREVNEKARHDQDDHPIDELEADNEVEEDTLESVDPKNPPA